MPEPRISQLDGMAAVPAAAWDRLLPVSQPFIRHAFLHALEASGSASADTGWEPCHLLARDGDRLTGALPLYRKHHSFGEFVFDWGWADACHRAGIRYYPKLLTAVPFSPVSGPRLLGDAGEELIHAAKAETERGGHASWHVLFPSDADRDRLAAAGLLLRKDCQFQWFDRGYGDFDGFLARLRSKRRKEIRRERRQVQAAGVGIRQLDGRELDEATLDSVYRCYARTYLLRGQQPYLQPDFFRLLAATAAESLVIFVASRAGRDIAVSICLRDDTALYGRYWGCTEDLPGLHFEACYYRGIEYCLENGLARFEPGTQGEHKISRGFEPVPVWSAHWFRQAELLRAVADFLQRETPMVDHYLQQAATLLPFRRHDA